MDPGIDHLLAMECFDEVHTAGGKVESFISYCGGQYYGKLKGMFLPKQI